MADAQFTSRIIGEGEEQADQLLANPFNFRVHGPAQQASLEAAIQELGWIQRVIVNVQTGHLVDGHLRVMLAMKRQEPTVPVLYVDLTPEEEQFALATIDPSAKMAGADKEKLLALLGSLPPTDAALTHVLHQTAQKVGAAYTDEGLELLGMNLQVSKRPDKKPDLFYTFSQGDGSCCIAVDAGLQYGTRSTKSRACMRHPANFVDNEWKDYDHEAHVACVAIHKPKYATVVDVLSRGQCEAAGITYRSLDEILKLAEDVQQHAQNVIVIPKYDCLKDIPKKYVLGYSVPSSYGGTPLAFDRFKGRRVHLLGGSPTRQFALWSQFPDEVVSIDTNYIHKVAMFGQIQGIALGRKYGIVHDPAPHTPETTIKDLGFPISTNHLYKAFAMSASIMAALFDPTYTPGRSA
jgi:hypothetical protein